MDHGARESQGYKNDQPVVKSRHIS
jgi:hypothetical protein